MSGGRKKRRKLEQERRRQNSANNKRKQEYSRQANDSEAQKKWEAKKEQRHAANNKPDEKEKPKQEDDYSRLISVDYRKNSIERDMDRKAELRKERLELLVSESDSIVLERFNQENLGLVYVWRHSAESRWTWPPVNFVYSIKINEGPVIINRQIGNNSKELERMAGYSSDKEISKKLRKIAVAIAEKVAKKTHISFEDKTITDNGDIIDLRGPEYAAELDKVEGRWGQSFQYEGLVFPQNSEKWNFTKDEIIQIAPQVKKADFLRPSRRLVSIDGKSIIIELKSPNIISLPYNNRGETVRYGSDINLAPIGETSTKYKACSRGISFGNNDDLGS